MKFIIITAMTALMAVPALIAAAPAGTHDKRQNYFTSAHYDDQDSVVMYVGNWTHIANDKLQLQGGTESFSKTPNAYVCFWDLILGDWYLR